MKIVEAQPPLYYEIPNRRVNGFVGREDILHEIDEALSNGSSPHYAVLQGMGGQGKTQVALEYCHRKRNNPYSAIFWVDATTQDTVERSFASISEHIKRRTDNLLDVKARVAFVLKTFTSWTVQWLMVFDNYDNTAAFPNIQDFIPQSEFGAILVTSRHPDSSVLVINQSSRFIKLSGLDENDAVALLIQQSQTKEAVATDAKKIVERLGCHPLALTQAGAYIKKRKLRLSKFMDHYKRRKKIILESTPLLSQYRKRLGNAEEETSLNVFTTWELSFRQLQSEAFEDGVEAKLLTLLAYFNEKDISEQLFAIFNANKEQILKSTKLTLWLKAFVSSETDQWDSDFFGDVLLRLSDSSLLQAFARGLDGFYHASLHPLIKDWIRLRTDKSASQENTYVASMLVSKILINTWQKEHFDLPLLAKQDIASHIIALDESYQEFFIPQPFIPSNQKIFDEFRISQFWFAKFLLTTGSYHLSEIMYQRLNVQNEKILGLEHPSTLHNMSGLASTYRNQGRWKEANELEVQVMETCLRVLGLEHLDTLTSIANLASTFSTRGRWKEAEELLLQVMETSSRVLGLEHHVTLTSMANLASIYRNQGRWKEAEDLNVKVVEMSSRVLGLEHPDTLTSMANLALTYRNQGRWKEAEELFVKVMETSSSVLGLEHPFTLTSVGNLASTFENQGRWKEAEELELQGVETSSRVLGLEHPDTLASMANLASTYRNQGRWTEAEELFVQVMATRKRVLGLKHPDTLISMANLASTSWNQGRWKEAEELFLQVMETSSRVLGLEHSDTLISMGNLALTYQNQGRWKEAKELEVQVMETRKKVLGLKHPDTLISMANLASTSWNQGRWKEAEELFLQVMETSSKVLGLEHPDTLTSIANLASTYRNQGRWKKAEDLEVQVMETRKRVLGLEHPDTLTNMGNLALTYQNQGRWKEAEELELHVMETFSRMLGLEHPSTLTSMANLASTYGNQGRWREAKDLFVQAMETRKRVLGLEHPSTLTSMANLAFAFWSLDLKKEAYQLMSKVVEHREKKIGSDHPDTVESVCFLQEWRGRWEES